MFASSVQCLLLSFTRLPAGSQPFRLRSFLAPPTQWECLDHDNNGVQSPPVAESPGSCVSFRSPNIVD